VKARGRRRADTFADTPLGARSGHGCERNYPGDSETAVLIGDFECPRKESNLEPSD
jgi:hypothetical protein